MVKKTNLDSFKKSIKNIASTFKERMYKFFEGLSNFFSLIGQRIITELQYKNDIREIQLKGKRQEKLDQAYRIGQAKAKAETDYTIAKIEKTYSIKKSNLNKPRQTYDIIGVQKNGTRQNNNDILGLSQVDIWGKQGNKKQKEMRWF